MLSSEPCLVLYGMAFIGALFACRLAVSRTDQTDKLPALPVPVHLNPYELAYLPYELTYMRGGKRAVERLAILDLLNSGHLCIRRHGESLWRSRLRRTMLEQVREGQGLPWYLSAALARFSTPHALEEMNDLWGGQWPRLQSELEERLKKERLLVTDEVRSAGRTAIAVSLIVLGVLSVPILPVISGLFSNALLVFLTVAVILVLVACDPGRLSKRGRTYLAQLRRAYREKSAGALLSGTTVAGASFEFALFGSESLKDTPDERLAEASDSGDSGDGGDGDGDD